LGNNYFGCNLHILMSYIAETKIQMKNSIILLILIFINISFVNAQPGPYSGILKFKVYKDGKIIDLSNKNWKVITGKYIYSEKQKPYKFPEFYQIIPKGTPMGGMVSDDFYLDIIFKKDTMKIYTPSFSSKDVILDSIPFLKGTFKIPQHNYDLKYITDTAATLMSEEDEMKTDTFTIKSQPFVLNNLLCYWEHFFVIYDNFGIEIEAKLYDYKTKQIILEYSESPRNPEYYYDYKSESYFDSINMHYFEDFNFDGYKDFSIYSYGSMAMTSVTSIYLFNNKTKVFDYSEELSDNTIEEIDTIKRILKTFSWDMENTYNKIHHFDRSGKLLFSEIFDYSNETDDLVYYRKIVNQKVIEQRTKK